MSTHRLIDPWPDYSNTWSVSCECGWLAFVQGDLDVALSVQHAHLVALTRTMLDTKEM